MPGRERERGREGGLARWNEPTLSRVAFEFFNVIQRGELSSLLRKGALEKKKISGYTRLILFFQLSEGSLFVRSDDHLETRSRIVKET